MSMRQIDYKKLQYSFTSIKMIYVEQLFLLDFAFGGIIVLYFKKLQSYNLFYEIEKNNSFKIDNFYFFNDRYL
jgi:hypothetical protein